MQTFLPFSDFKLTAQCLDYRRLGKQRVEAKQIFQAITNPNYGWQNHPAVKMWRGFPEALKEYHNTMIVEWIDRGYNNTMPFLEIIGNIIMPRWIGNEQFHSSHRQTLLFKNYEWYSQFGWKEAAKYEYIWPIT